METLFNGVFLPSDAEKTKKGKVRLLWYRKALKEKTSSNIDCRPNHFALLLHLPSGKRKFNKGDLTLVPKNDFPADIKPEQKRIKRGAGSLITSYFQCHKEGMQACCV